MNRSGATLPRTRLHRDGKNFDGESVAMNSALISRFSSGNRKVAAGQDIFSAGEPNSSIYGLLEGWAFLYSLLPDGRRQILHFVLPGDVLGFHAISGGMTVYNAQALTDATLSVIPPQKLSTVARECPEFVMRLAEMISYDRSLAYDHLTSVGRQTARERVAHLILELFIRCRARWPGHRIDDMELPLTQEHVGDATGLTSIHVNRVLRALRKERIVQFHYKRLQVLNPDRLVDVAGVAPHLVAIWTRSRLILDKVVSRGSKPEQQVIRLPDNPHSKRVLQRRRMAK